MSGTVSPELDLRVLASGLDHVEGVCWDPVRRCVWAGGEAGQVYRIGLDGSVETAATIEGGVLLGLALGREGDLFVCDPGNHRVWRVDATMTPRPFGDPVTYPNYPAFGPDGRLYVSDSGSFFEATGRVLAIDDDGTTRDVSPRPVAFANGLAFDGTTLWVVESSAPGVSAMDIDGGPLELVIAMERCVPDGLALDGEGGLWISCYQPNQLWRWTRKGGLDLVFDEWSGEQILSPTNVAFIGDEYDRLALASLCGHDVTTIRPGHRGAAVQHLREEAR
ncbi:MAG TPA: SMP-30/gluconolactonase/LRE family protein [Acidimicrobiales bacterium]|nr:SMP-30/gluconolactonase/LRE family protein [Acidimicrobiales bacterium]